MIVSFFFKVVETVAATLRSINVSEAELKAAKKALAVEIGEASIQVLIFYVEILIVYLKKTSIIMMLYFYRPPLFWLV